MNLDTQTLALCDTIGAASTCPKANVGAVITQWGMVVASACNGSPGKVTTCKEAGCVIIPATDDHREYSRHLHAEMAAIAELVRNPGRNTGMRTDQMTLYVNVPPCLDCSRMIVGCGFELVVTYDITDEWIATIGDYLNEGGVKVISYERTDAATDH